MLQQSENVEEEWICLLYVAAHAHYYYVRAHALTQHSHTLLPSVNTTHFIEIKNARHAEFFGQTCFYFIFIPSIIDPRINKYIITSLTPRPRVLNNTTTQKTCAYNRLLFFAMESGVKCSVKKKKNKINK